MIRLRVLGATELRDADGRELRSVLAQPKRLALLVYLAATPGFHRRDTLLALFWPELDAARAREALNQAVRFLRKALGGSPDAVLVGRGAAELGVEPGTLWCDLAAFRELVAAKRFGEALDLYRGDLLPGFFAEQSAGFEEWLDAERGRLRLAAAAAAREVAEAHEREAHYTTAVVAARRAVDLAGLDERAVRNLLALLDRLGDRAGAIHAFEEFAGRLAAELEAEPAAETRALVARIRQRALTGDAPAPRHDAPTDAPHERLPEEPREPALAAAREDLRIVRELGRGGTATVFMARDAKHDRHVALKLLHPELATLVGTERFLREIQITAQLAHPHVLPLIDSGVRDGLPYLVTPYVAGETLRARLERETRLPLGDALRLCTEIAEALDYAHRCGIVHRDVKPENVLLADGHALVADFGIARAIAAADTPRDRAGATGVVVGSPAYMSPEALRGGPIGAQGDIFALGCLLVETASGTLPARGASAAALARAHALPWRVARLAAECLATEPARRPRSAAEVVRRLELLTGESAAPPRRARRAAIGAGALLTVTLLAVLGARVRARLDTEATAALDSTRYVVLPAEASAGGAAELLRGALARWTGISVVDGTELAEALRGVSAEARATALGPLPELARRLDAGRVIRVQATRIGESLSVRQVLYDPVQRRSLVERTVRLAGDLAHADSTFAATAERLLFPGDSAPPLGDSRSRSVPARRAFARGRVAANEWRLTLADSQFRRATELDAEDVHAWLWLALARQWRGAPVAEWGFAAERAARADAALEPAGRLAAQALAALAHGDRMAACAHWSAVTRLAPESFVGWWALGDCLRNDSLVVRDARSPSGWRFRASHAAALRAFEQAFVRYPPAGATPSSAWFRTVRSVIAPVRSTLRAGVAGAPARGEFAAWATWQGDSIAYVPVPRDSVLVDGGWTHRTEHETAALRQRIRFHELAQMWRRRLEGSPEALEALAIALDLRGSASAVDSLAAARRALPESGARVRLAALEVWLRLKRAAPRDPAGVRAARALADSLLDARAPLDPANAGALAALAALTGRSGEAARLSRIAEAGRVPVALEASGPSLVAFAALGGPVDSLRAYGDAVARAIDVSLEPDDRVRERMRWVRRAEMLAVPLDAWRGAPLQPSASKPEQLLAAWRARRAATLDSVLVAGRTFRARQGIAASDVTVDVAYYEAAMLASLGREARAAEWLDPALGGLAERDPASLADVARAGTLVRAMALRADLAARMGDAARAHRWAATVLALWPHADPHLRPTLDRMQHLVQR